MSIAISPSPTTSNSPAPALPLPLHSAMPPRKPKLTLNTTNLDLGFGKRPSLRVEVLSAVSPTQKHTLCNTLPVKHNPLPRSKRTRPTLTSLSTNVTSEEPLSEVKEVKPSETSEPAGRRRSSLDSTSARQHSLTVDPSEVPYTQTSTGILSNGPFSLKKSRQISSAPPRETFPDMKHVTFRSPLAEYIKARKISTTQADQDGSSEEDVDAAESQESQDKRPFAERVTFSPHPHPNRSKHQALQEKESFPGNTIAGTRKRARDWVWTLSPVNSCQPPRPWAAMDTFETPISA